MAIDVKKIQDGARKTTQHFITYVKNHPFFPATLAFLLFLYVFLPSLFVFLVFVVPIFIFIAIAFRLIFHIHQQNLRNAKGTHEACVRKLTPSRGGRNLDKRGNSYAHARSVRRRNSKKHELRVHFEDDTYEKGTIFSIGDENPLVDKAPLIEEKTKEIREIEVEPKICGDGSGLRASKFSENSEEDDEEEEEVSENRNKVVEWTDDDQKNLMDLGFSEMERNKRLESLIAKRKARKLLSLQVRRTLMNIGKTEPLNEIASILIPKTGAFSRTKSGENIISPTPGSAPSVLLPVHNPFDLPYDPQEEKPNLLGGFQEELVDNHHNDAVFCRHESFSLGTFSSRPWELDSGESGSSHGQDLDIMPKIRENPRLSRFGNQSGNQDSVEVSEPESSQESKTTKCTNSFHDLVKQSEDHEKALDSNTSKLDDFTKDDFNLNDFQSAKRIEGDSKLDTDDVHESISSSSSEINAPFSNANRDEILRSLSFSLRKNIPIPKLDTNARRDAFSYLEYPSPYDRRLENDPFFNTIHTRSQSLASDLQVEVSEVGSQMTNLSSDGESPKYDMYVGKEGNFGNEEIPEVSDHDILEVGFSENRENVEEPIVLEHNRSHEEVESSSPDIPEILSTDNVEKEGNFGNEEVPEVSDQGILEVGFSKNQENVEEPIVLEHNNRIHEEVESPCVDIPEILSTDNVEKEGYFGNEDVPKVSDQDILEVGFSKNQENVEEPVVLEHNRRHEEVESPSTDIPEILSTDNVEKEGNIGNEEVPEVSDQDILEVGFSKNQENVEEPIVLEHNRSHEEVESPSTDIPEILSTDHVENAEDSSNSVEKFLEDKQIVYDINDQVEIVKQNKAEIGEQSSNEVENFLVDKKIVYDIELVHEDQEIIDFIEDTYGKDVETIDHNSNFVESFEGSDFMGNNNSEAREIVAEKGVDEASSSCTRSATMDDDPSIHVEKNTEDIESNNSSNQTQTLAASDRAGPSGTNPSPARTTEAVVALGVEPTSPDSVLQKQFSVDLASSMSFDDVRLASLLPNSEMEQSGASTTTEQIHDGNFVGSQESSIPLSQSIEENTNLSVNDRDANNITGDKLVQTSAEIDSLAPTEKNEKIEGVDTTNELQTSKDLETRSEDSVGLQKSSSPLGENVNDAAINTSNPIEKIETTEEDEEKSRVQVDIGSTTEEQKLEETKVGEAIEESKR